MKAKAVLPILILILLSIALQASSAQVDLSFDLEIKEPEDIIFNLIVDIAVDSENSIFILDIKEKVLYKFSEEGKLQKRIGRSGQGPGEFERPNSVFIDAKDNIYILDSQNRRVEVFKNNGDFTKSIKLNRFPNGGRN
ncbi:MAG: 6-bladed beta-propeller, partial [Candidatus Aminicenantes bacterium]|nr:6-bladed beta-propeller [Candidatus Aminicenantes bacterium]